MKNREDILIDLCIDIHTRIEHGEIGYAIKAVKDYCDSQNKLMKDRLYLAEDKAKEQYQQKWDIIEAIDDALIEARIEEIHRFIGKADFPTVQNMRERIAQLKKEQG